MKEGSSENISRRDALRGGIRGIAAMAVGMFTFSVSKALASIIPSEESRGIAKKVQEVFNETTSREILVRLNQSTNGASKISIIKDAISIALAIVVSEGIKSNRTISYMSALADRTFASWAEEALVRRAREQSVSFTATEIKEICTVFERISISASPSV